MVAKDEEQRSVRPLGDRLVVQVDENERTRPSGLILPGTVDQGTIRTGVIVALGPGRRNPDNGFIVGPVDERIPMDERLVVGARVAYLHFQAFETASGARGGFKRADEAPTALLHESDVLGIYDGPVGALRN